MKRSVAEATRSYTAAYGDGETRERASADVDSGRRSPGVAGPSVLRPTERHPRRGRLRPVRGGAVSVILRAGAGAPEPAAGAVLSVAAAGLFRGPGLGAGHRVARGRFAGGAQLRGAGPRRHGPGSFHDLAHATADRRGDPSRGVHVGAGTPGRGRP